MSNDIGLVLPEDLMELVQALNPGESLTAQIDACEYSRFTLMGLGADLAAKGYRNETITGCCDCEQHKESPEHHIVTVYLDIPESEEESQNV